MTEESKSNDSSNKNNVYLGRGGATNNAEGNRRFRLLVAENQQEYLKARKRDKVLIARRIVGIVQSNGGSFLKRGTDDDTWVPVTDKRAQEKTSQALREGLDVRNNTIRPNKIIKAMRRNSESSSSHTGSQQSAAADSKPSALLTGKVVAPKTNAAAMYAGLPLQTTSNRNATPGLTGEPSDTFFLLYQPPPISQQVIDHSCEV